MSDPPPPPLSAGEKQLAPKPLNTERLPTGWTMQVAPNGRVFFIDHIQKKTTWMDPRNSRASPLPSQSNDDLSPLPEGWEKSVHTDGRTFFINHISKKTTWVDPRNTENTELVKAAKSGDEDSVTKLLQQGADAELVNTGLWYSAAFGHDKIVRIFHEHGGDVNKRSWKKKTPLIASAIKGHLTTTRLLLDLGAEINLQDDDGETALMKAVKMDNSEVENELKTRGADESIQNTNGNTVHQLYLNKDLIAAE